MKKGFAIVLLLFLTACTQTSPAPQQNASTFSPIQSPASPTKQPVVSVRPSVPSTKTIPQTQHVFQSFNNCGPATYSMLLSYLRISESQQVLGDRLRPYQIKSDDNDDKSVTVREIAEDAQKYNLNAYYRPNGTIEKIKQYIAADIPVMLRVWLNDTEDIGHYVIVRGYDEQNKTILMDDSYYGPNRTISYDTLKNRWQPFNYEYLVLTNSENDTIAMSILDKEIDEKVAWQNALERAENEDSSSNPYPKFNQATAHFHLGNFTESVQTYESVQSQLPRRMLWYHTQPIESYLELKQHDKIIQLTDAILNNANSAYSELYLIRAKSYLNQNDKEKAREQLTLAIRYNQNYEEPKKLLDQI